MTTDTAKPTTMRYDVRHVTRYQYEADVTLSHHVLRLTPRELSRQRCLEHGLIIEPTPTSLHQHTDYYGNALNVLTIGVVHGTFQVEARSRVEVESPVIPEPESTPAWDEHAIDAGEDAVLADPSVDEFLHDSPLVRRQPELVEYATPSFEPGRPVLAAVLDLTQRIFADFKFDPKATTVATPLKEVLRLRRGVCQDFAQLQIGCLRALGIPARYVSGYLETLPPPGKPKLVGADASHAWIAFHCPGVGWIDVDPTNNQLPSFRHITVAWGRDYSDVSPIRGVILGAGNHELEVSVDVTPLPGPEDEIGA
jgi:transglutaminase-like putative cysteine protease